jgi:RNA polymerase sigma factor (sigma-70 family)
MNDAELLQKYASDNSEAAFHALVEQHLPLVYSIALRQVGEPTLAENLALVVFILLARKSDQLPPETVLPDWLFRTTREVMAKSLRSDQYRRYRQQRSFGFQDSQPTDIWEQIVDGALAQLGNAERVAVLLHYFQFKRIGEVGLALGASEDTVQKRIARAIHKLRKLLLAHGVDLPVTVLPGLLMTRGAQAPSSDLAASVRAAALNQVAVSTAVYALLQGAERESVWPKAKTALRKVAAVGAVAVIIGLVVHFWPRRTLGDSPAYSFETKIVMRPRYVAPLPAPPVLASAKAIAASSTDKPADTNSPSPPERVAVAQSRPAPTNTAWAPGLAVAELGPLIPSSSGSGEPSTMIPSSSPSPSPEPDSASPVQPTVWSPAFAYSPARNVVQVGAGFIPFSGTNVTPWTAAQRSVAVIPARGMPAKPPAKK